MAGEAPIFGNAVYNSPVAFAEGDGTDKKVVAFGNTGPLVLRALNFANLSATAYTFDILLRKDSADFQAVRVEVPANAGHAVGVPPFNAIDPDVWSGLDSEPNTKLTLDADEQLVVQAVAGLGAGHEVHVIAMGSKVT